MACCKKTVPTFGVLQVNITDATATLMLDGVLPVSGRFNVRVQGCCLDVCSAKPIVLTDAAGTSITNIIGRCGNKILLNKVAVQARRHKELHFCRSADTQTLVVLLDKICAPTPIMDTSTTPAATPSSPVAKAKAGA